MGLWLGAGGWAGWRAACQGVAHAARASRAALRPLPAARARRPTAPLSSHASLNPPSCPPRERYDYIMVADDDMVLDACVVDTVFDVRAAWGCC